MDSLPGGFAPAVVCFGTCLGGKAQAQQRPSYEQFAWQCFDTEQNWSQLRLCWPLSMIFSGHEVFTQENTLYKYCNLFSFTGSFVWFLLEDS